MLKILKSIHEPSDIKKLNPNELEILAKEVRAFLIQSLSQTGGHLASNLGVVELTIALHYVFNSPQDKVIWDVGHQAYVHKLLTGRRKEFKTLRQLDGLSGFPKRKESPHDAFETGHSSTSISAALGMAKVRDLKGEDNKVIAIIGDGALTGGMAFEALNNAGRGHTNLIVILNDNEMSISKNVGGIGKYLNRLRSSQDYLRVKEDVEDVLHKVPVVGEYVADTLKRTKESVKSFMMDNTLFEQLGFTYLGPIDGHNYDELIDLFENAKSMRGPIFIHIKTKKGKGYKKAEQKPSEFHGVGPFCIATGVGATKAGSETFSSAFGKAMIKVADEDNTLVGITAAMPEGTGLLDFSKAFPKRFFDVGIAEQHAVTFAAGMAAEGYKPVVAVYSTFLQRAYDQILHDVCLQDLHVIFGVDRAGLVGEDGETHQGIYDIAYLSTMPNMRILSPKMPQEVEYALSYAQKYNGPIAIRYPRGGMIMDETLLNDYTYLGFKVLRNGNTMAIIASGRMVQTALDLRELLLEEGIDLTVIEAPCLYPIDTEQLEEIAKSHEYLFTLEDGIREGGFGERAFAHLMTKGFTIKGDYLGYRNRIVPHGKVDKLIKQEGLDPEGIKVHILTIFKKESNEHDGR